MFCEFLLKAFRCKALDFTTHKISRFWWHIHHPIRSGRHQQNFCFAVVTSTIKRKKKENKKKSQHQKKRKQRFATKKKKESRGLLDKKLEESLPRNKVENMRIE